MADLQATFAYQSPKAALITDVAAGEVVTVNFKDPVKWSLSGFRWAVKPATEGDDILVGIAYALTPDAEDAAYFPINSDDFLVEDGKVVRPANGGEVHPIEAVRFTVETGPVVIGVSGGGGFDITLS